MKNIRFTIIVGLIGFGINSFSVGTAFADLITGFNFNNSGTLLMSTAGQTATITSAFTGFIQNSGTSINAYNGESAGNDLTFNKGSTDNGKYFQFSVDSTGFSDLILSYATQRSTTGFTTETLAYSLNGTSFTNFQSVTTGTSFALASFNLSSVDAIENVSQVYFRVTLSGATSTGGTGRFDNLQVNGSAFAPVPEPSTVLGGLALVGLIGLRERRRFSALRKLGLFS